MLSQNGSRLESPDLVHVMILMYSGMAITLNPKNQRSRSQADSLFNFVGVIAHKPQAAFVQTTFAYVTVK